MHIKAELGKHHVVNSVDQDLNNFNYWKDVEKKVVSGALRSMTHKLLPFHLSQMGIRQFEQHRGTAEIGIARHSKHFV